jgi:hypothetical protein
VILYTKYQDVAIDENGDVITDEYDNPVILKEYSDSLDITEDVDFGTATPSSTYNVDQTDFKYNVVLYYNGKALVDAFGKNATATVYIGLKGDADLSNNVDGSDAGAILSYFANVGSVSTEEEKAQIQLSTVNPIVSGPDSVYDHFAAFLSDVDSKLENNWCADKSIRNVDGSDAAYVLSYYAQVGANKEPGKALWNEIMSVIAEY